MKKLSLSVTLLALASMPRAFAGTASLACDALPTLIYAVDSIQVDGDNVKIVYHYADGEPRLDQGVRSGATSFRTSYGVELSIPAELLNGRATGAMTVGLSTYDYPYESVSCRISN
jgi:hypothetical protein